MRNVRTKSQRISLAGIGAPVVREDFGGMGDIWDDIGNWAQTTVDKTVTKLQSQATNTVIKAAQNFVVKLTGVDGTTKNVTLTAEQAAQYQASGTLPVGVLPAGYMLPPQSFLEKYQQPLILGGVAIVALISMAMIYRMVRTK